MNIIVSHVYSKENKGDAALLSVLLGDIRRAFGDPHITILTLDAIGNNEIFEGAAARNSFMYYARHRYRNTLLVALYAFFVTISTLLWAVIYRVTGKNFPLPKNLRDIAMLYQEADLIIPVGGGYIRSKAGMMSTITLFFIIQPFLFTWILGKPTIGYSQSIGPFGNRFQEWMARFAVKRINGVVARELISFQILKKWGITKNVLLSADSGFSFPNGPAKDLREEWGISKQQMIVGVTVRDWMNVQGQARYERVLTAFCDATIKKYNAFIVFIPQVTVENHRDDDRESSKRVYGLMDHKNNARVLSEHYDHQVIKSIYGGLDYLVGTRFHSVIFALTSYVPCIAIEYEHKTRGIMADLGLEKWVVGIHNIEVVALADLFDKLVLERLNYIHHLETTLPAYIEKSRKTIDFIKHIYDNF